MRVSVVIPTYRRPQALKRCLDALARQERAPDEVIVVARREDRATRAVVGERGGAVRLVLIEVPQGRPGVVNALNAGVAASCGEIVCLTDDDAEAHPDWISQMHGTFVDDPQVGAVGGRDWVFNDGRLEDRLVLRVGTISRFGRITGNHHLGVGPPRDVAVLKGVNLGVRGDLVRSIGFDTRLLAVATEHHWELGLCLQIGRMGYRVVYDPAIAVDHRPQPRVSEDRVRRRRDVHDAAHNETLALLEHLTPFGRLGHLLWVTAVGSRVMPGLASFIRLQFSAQKKGALALLRGNLSGRRHAIGNYLHSRAVKRAALGHRSGSPSSGSIQILSICETSGAAERAEQLLAGVPSANVVSAAPGGGGILGSALAVLSTRATVLYLVDIGKATTIAAVLGRLIGRRVVVDTGDASFALARSVGERDFIGLLLVGFGEQLALHSAHEIVVRGRNHAAYVPRRATHIPDLPPLTAGPAPTAELRQELDLDGTFVVGLVGSLNFAPRRRTSYGWDLIDALPFTDSSVVALIVGDGSGLEPLRQRAIALGVADRCRFVGRIPVDRVCSYVSLMNAAISTQSNDVVGQVRTTGKLPLYLACGCPVLASHVGEAAILLDDLGWTLPYSGVVDPEYPRRLAAAIESWRLSPIDEASRRMAARRVAREAFNARDMQARLANVIYSGAESAD